MTRGIQFPPRLPLSFHYQSHTVQEPLDWGVTQISSCKEFNPQTTTSVFVRKTMTDFFTEVKTETGEKRHCSYD